MVPGLPGAKNTRFSREPPGSLRPPIGLRGHQDPPGNPPVPTRDPDAAVGHKGHIWRQRWGTRGTFGGSGGAHRAHLAAAQRAQLASGHSGGEGHHTRGTSFGTTGAADERGHGTAGTNGGHSGHSWRVKRAKLAEIRGPGSRRGGSWGEDFGEPGGAFGGSPKALRVFRGRRGASN